jgi:Tfp pilus assembly protein PilX
MQEMKNKIFNEEGVTLLELLASLVILTLIGFTFVSFFTQSMLFTERTEDNLDYININQQLLNEAEEELKNYGDPVMESSFNGEQNDFFHFIESEDDLGYFMETNNGSYVYPDISVQPTEQLALEGGNANINAYHVTVVLLNEEREIISERYRLVYEQELQEGGGS